LEEFDKKYALNIQVLRVFDWKNWLRLRFLLKFYRNATYWKSPFALICISFLLKGK